MGGACQFFCSDVSLVLLSDPRRGFGLLHRLDANSSGLVLGAQTHMAYYHLQWQLDSLRIGREYVVLCHGFVPPGIGWINARLKQVEGNQSVVASDGRPSMTELKVQAHLCQEGRQYSLLAMSIRTGRSHQIRAHLQFIGHPAVCDSKYSNAQTFEYDKTWCPHNFVHRCRLSFADCFGGQHQATQPLSKGLQSVLASLEPANEWSAKGVQPWLDFDVMSFEECPDGGVHSRSKAAGSSNALLVLNTAQEKTIPTKESQPRRNLCWSLCIL